MATTHLLMGSGRAARGFSAEFTDRAVPAYAAPLVRERVLVFP